MSLHFDIMILCDKAHFNVDNFFSVIIKLHVCVCSAVI